MAVDNHRHCTGPEETREVIVNMSVAISTISLHQKCKETGQETLKEEDVPSMLWFRFQFWPKGRFKVKYMMQRRLTRKQHEDHQYCACIYHYM